MVKGFDMFPFLPNGENESFDFGSSEGKEDNKGEDDRIVGRMGAILLVSIWILIALVTFLLFLSSRYSSFPYK